MSDKDETDMDSAVAPLVPQTDGTVQEQGVTVTPEGLRYDDQGRRLCGAKRTNGQPCRAPAMAGQRVCYKHGGAKPSARRAARLRLMELVDPAVATLAREMVQADSSRDRQSAANSILDRAGIARTVKEVSVEESRALLIERIRAIKARAEERTIDGTVDDPNKEDEG